MSSPTTPTIRPIGPLPKGVYQSEGWMHTRYFRYSGVKRCPKKGEWFLSGAIITAYQAPNDLSMAYHIAVEVGLEVCGCCGGTGRGFKDKGVQGE